jgi:hypothetical protein
MKMKRMFVTFEKSMTVTLYAPPDMGDAEIEELAHDLAANGLRGWDDPAWDASVSPSKDITIPDADLKCGPTNAYGYRRCLVPQFQGDCVVVNDDRTDMVAPEDAQWWVASYDLSDTKEER